jgi:hypothetical protein
MQPWIDVQCRGKVPRVIPTKSLCRETAMEGRFAGCSFAKYNDAQSGRDPAQARLCGPLSMQLLPMMEALETSGEDNAEV